MNFLLPLALLMIAGRTTVTSRAGFSIPNEHHKGAASVVADIVWSASGTTGTFTYAAEDHPDHEHDGTARGPAAMYPEIVVNLRKFSSVVIDGKRAEIKGSGRFHSDAVRVTAILVDNAGTGKADHFEIVCKDANGHVVYERIGDIETGDISIRSQP